MNRSPPGCRDSGISEGERDGMIFAVLPEAVYMGDSSSSNQRDVKVFV
jgi:hypothetical protein